MIACRCVDVPVVVNVLVNGVMKTVESRGCCSPWVVQFLDKVVDVPVVLTTGAVFRQGR